MAVRASLTLSLPALRTFEAVARLGGLTAAAEELGLTVSAISHQLRGLERALGVSLLRRQGRGVVLTEQGAPFAGELEQAFADIDVAVDRLRSARPTLTVTVQPTFAARWLMPRLHRFDALAPGVDLRLSTTPRLVDLARERIDCAIRLGPGGWSNVAEQLLMPQREGPVARVQQQGAGAMPRILLQGRADEWESWTDLPSGAGVLTVSTREMAVEAVLAGAGIGILDILMVERELARGEISLLAPPCLTSWSYYFVTRKDEGVKPIVRLFGAWLADEAKPSLA